MRNRVIATLASVVVTASLAACSSDNESSNPTGPAATNGGSSNGSATGPTVGSGVTVAPGATSSGSLPSNLPGLPSVTLPPGLTIPPGGTFPPGITIPQDYIDALIAQLEGAGMTVDHDCFKTLMQDEEMQRTIFTASTPSNEIIQKLTACFKA